MVDEINKRDNLVDGRIEASWRRWCEDKICNQNAECLSTLHHPPHDYLKLYRLHGRQTFWRLNII